MLTLRSLALSIRDPQKPTRDGEFDETEPLLDPAVFAYPGYELADPSEGKKKPSDDLEFTRPRSELPPFHR